MPEKRFIRKIRLAHDERDAFGSFGGNARRVVPMPNEVAALVESSARGALWRNFLLRTKMKAAPRDFAEDEQPTVENHLSKMDWAEGKYGGGTKDENLLQDIRIETASSPSAAGKVVIFEAQNESVPPAQFRLDVLEHEFDPETGSEPHVDHRDAQALFHRIGIETKWNVRTAKEDHTGRRKGAEVTVLVDDAREEVPLRRYIVPLQHEREHRGLK